jgi:hypothetical protein
VHKAFGATLYKLKEICSSRNCKHIRKSFVTCVIAVAPYFASLPLCAFRFRRTAPQGYKCPSSLRSGLKSKTEEWVSG